MYRIQITFNNYYLVAYQDGASLYKRVLDVQGNFIKMEETSINYTINEWNNMMNKVELFANTYQNQFRIDAYEGQYTLFLYQQGQEVFSYEAVQQVKIGFLDLYYYILGLFKKPQGVICPHCGKVIKEDDYFCGYCGKSIVGYSMFNVIYTRDLDATIWQCRRCGNFNMTDQPYCPRCGESFVIKPKLTIREARPLDPVDIIPNTYILENGYEIVGYLHYALFFDAHPIMNKLYIHEQYRGKGYGRYLVEFFEEEMTKKGHTLILTTTQVDEYAQHFYQHLGYEVVGGFNFPNQAYELILLKKIEM